MKKISILCLSAFAFFSVRAQDNTSTDTTKNKSITLDEVVIAVNKEEETKKTVAQQVQVLTSQDIRKSQAQSTADLIASTGIPVQKSQMGGGSPVIRGFEANRILLVIDGVRMNNLIYRGGHLQDIIKTDNNSLDRVEILFGPSSTIYGSDALGGVIHLYTQKPLLAVGDQSSNIQVNTTSRYGSVNNEMTEHFDFNFGTKNFGSLTSCTYAKFGDLMGGKNQNPFYATSYGERTFYVKRFNNKDSLVKNTNRYLQVGSAYSQYDLMQKFLLRSNEHITQGLNFQYSGSSNVGRYDRLTDPSSTTGLKSAEWYYGPQMRLLTAYDLNMKRPEGKLEGIHLGLNYQALTESRHNRNFGSSYKNNRMENVGIIGANLDVQKKIKTNDIRFGIDIQLNSLKSTANKEDILADTSGKLDTRFPDGTNSMNNFAAYFSHTLKINEELTLTDGLRAGYSILHSTLVDTALQFHLPYTEIEQKTPVYSGSIGLINCPSDDLKLSMLLSTGFRVPNVDDVSKIFGSSPGMVIVPNVDLKPEKTVNCEIGITRIFNKKTRWENAIYYTTFTNVAVVDKFQMDGKDSIIYDGTLSAVYANQNKDEAYLYGFSSQLISKLDDHFMMTLGINYTYGRIKTDTSDAPLDHIPPFMAQTKFAYVNNKFSSDFSINYSGAKKLKDYYLNGEDNEQYATPMGMPAWFTINYRVSYRIHKSITVQAGIDNVFDTQYRTFSSGINAPGRNCFLTVRGNF